MVIKKIVLIIIVIANIGLMQAQYTAIPDTCFEQHLIDLGIDNEGLLDGQVLTADITNITSLTMNGIDANGNNYDCYIESLEGIDFFNSLETLDVSINGIQHIDVSNLPNLKNLYCDDNFTQTLALPPSIEIVYARFNRFTQNIDFTQTTHLKELHLDGFFSANESESHITNIDVHNCPELIEITADFNDIISMDTSNNPLLEVLSLGEMYSLDGNDNVSIETFTHNNPNLKYLTIVGHLTILNTDEMVNLEKLQVLGNSIPSLDLTNNIHLNDFRFADDDSLSTIDFRNNNNNLITVFAMSNNPNLTCIYVDDAQNSTTNWTNIDSNSTFVETEAECEALAISEENVVNITVYPNPIKDKINISSSVGIKNVMVYNLLGKRVITSDKSEVNVSTLTNGIYIVKVITNDGKITSKKIIKS